MSEHSFPVSLRHSKSSAISMVMDASKTRIVPRTLVVLGRFRDALRRRAAPLGTRPGKLDVKGGLNSSSWFPDEWSDFLAWVLDQGAIGENSNAAHTMGSGDVWSVWFSPNTLEHRRGQPKTPTWNWERFLVNQWANRLRRHRPGAEAVSLSVMPCDSPTGRPGS